MNKYGGFINPNPTKMSDFQNDYNYMIIKEYKLNENNLSKSPSITIDNIKAGSTITKISLKVNNIFTSKDDTAIEIVTDSGETLFSKSCNNMNVTGTYISDCYYKTNGNENEISINHSLDKKNGTFVTIDSTSRNWHSVCYGNGKFVTVSSGTKYFAYSTDGINWTEGTISDTSRNWYSVCYGNGKFVTVANNDNYFAYSTDGINWTEGTISDTSRSWYSVCYGNDKFVAVSNSKYFAYSTDGINWTESTISSTSRYWQ